MKPDLPEIITRGGFSCFGSLNQAERRVVLMGDEAYRESLDLDNDDAPCWKIPSKESTTFVGWNPMCVPTIDYIVWKLERRQAIIRGEVH
tara:strand:+ start:452 stop:721 length:270 start_codon:yes stop_codon:yes gene_type:complete